MKTTLIRGDCLEEMKKIPDGSIDLVLTDIPYEAARKTNFKSIKDFTKKEGETAYSCMDFGDWDKDFPLRASLELVFRKIKNPSSVVLYANWKQLADIHQIYQDCIPKSLQREPRIGVWQKTNPSVFNMQRMAIQPYEFMIWLGVGSNMTFNNQNSPKPERLYFESATQRGSHPTAKNIEHMEHLIKTYTNEGETVLDFTMGSGTTGVACKNLNRHFIGIEIDQNYYQLARDRILKYGTT